MISHYFSTFFFSIYPYIVMVVFLFGSLIRFDREQYTWKSDSSQLLQPKYLRVGNILFHVGILGLFFGHFFGLLTPLAFWELIGITPEIKQIMAMSIGGLCGIMALIGLLILIYRRFSCPRLLKNSTWRDKLVLIWILITLCLGLSTLFVSAQHIGGSEMLSLISWVQHIVTFRGGTVEIIADVSLVFKIHIVMGLTLFLIFPFTRLVHIWSGFGTIVFLKRPTQLVRSRKYQ